MCAFTSVFCFLLHATRAASSALSPCRCRRARPHPSAVVSPPLRLPSALVSPPLRHHPPLMEHPCTSSRSRGSIGINHRDNGSTSCSRTSFYAVQTLNAAYSISTSIVKNNKRCVFAICRLMLFVIYDSTEIKKLECVNRDAAPVSLSNTTVPAPSTFA